MNAEAHDYSLSLRGRAEELIADGRYEDAIATLDSSMDTDDVHLNYLLGVAAFRLGRDQLAESAFTRVVGARPDDAQALYGLGMTLRRLGRERDARQAFVDAVAADPSMNAARDQLAAPPTAPVQTPGFSEQDPTTSSMADLLDARGAP